MKKALNSRLTRERRQDWASWVVDQYEHHYGEVLTADTDPRKFFELAHNLLGETDLSRGQRRVVMRDLMDHVKQMQANPVVLEDYGNYCEELSKAYDKAPAFDTKELWRWKKLEEHILRFWKRITRKLDVQFVPGQPYDDAEQMRDEVARTGTLLISTDFNEHPVFDPDTNLKFRAVHDYVVHILPGDQGPDFSEKGEIKAYNLHRRLAPPDTWPALFTEVAAQACYANARGEFPEQKVAVIPGFDYYNVGLAANPKKLKARLLR